MHKFIQSKSVLNKLNSKFLPYNWDLNVYRGCEHKCVYCYALYSHQYLDNGSDNFFDTVYVKENADILLEKKLSSKKWQGEVVNLGGVTDSYQPLESKLQLMPKILKVLLRYPTPVTISTKSALILRDKDLWVKLAEYVPVNIAVTVTTTNEILRRKIEPGGAPSKARLKVLEEFGDTKVSTGLHLMPALPFITDNKENIDEVLGCAKAVGVDYVLVSSLNLRGLTRGYYLNFIKKEFPEFVEKYRELFVGSFSSKEYRRGFYNMVSELKRKHGLRSDSDIFRKAKIGRGEQIEMF